MSNQQIDKKFLSDDLKKLFMRYQHRLDHPMSTEPETENELISRYFRDSLFHAKVDALTYGVMNVIERHL